MISNAEIRFFIDKDLSILNGSLQMSEEGFAHIVKRLLHKYVDAWYFTTVDTFNGIFTLMNVGGVLDKLTYYSPIEDKIKINKFTLHRAINTVNPLYSSIEVPKPRGMVASYKDVKANNVKIFEAIDIHHLLSSAEDGIETITSWLSDNSIDEKEYTRLVTRLVDEKVVNPQKLYHLDQEHHKQFKGNPTVELTSRLEVEFGDIKGFRSFLDEMIEVFANLIKLKDIRKEIDDQAVKVRNIVTLLEHRDDIVNRNNLKPIIKFFDYLTNSYQLFGAVCLSHMAMETNLGYVIDEIIKLKFS